MVLTPVLPVWETAWQLGFWFTFPVKHETITVGLSYS